MVNQVTSDKLIEMRLTAMADAYRSQESDPKMADVPFDDRFGMLVDIEYSSQKSNRLKRLIKKAEFDQPEAHIAGILNIYPVAVMHDPVEDCIGERTCIAAKLLILTLWAKL